MRAMNRAGDMGLTTGKRSLSDITGVKQADFVSGSSGLRKVPYLTCHRTLKLVTDKHSSVVGAEHRSGDGQARDLTGVTTSINPKRAGNKPATPQQLDRNKTARTMA
jgi:hypothetical protein